VGRSTSSALDPDPNEPKAYPNLEKNNLKSHFFPFIVDKNTCAMMLIILWEKNVYKFIHKHNFYIISLYSIILAFLVLLFSLVPAATRTTTVKTYTKHITRKKIM
jgi:hypothetical protein